MSVRATEAELSMLSFRLNEPTATRASGLCCRGRRCLCHGERVRGSLGGRVPSPGAFPTFAVALVLGELEAGAALAGNAPLGGLPADVGTAMVLVHAVHAF